MAFINEQGEKKYKVHYIAEDGTKCSFTLWSSKRMGVSARFRSGSGYDLGFPFMADLNKAIEKYKNNPESKMAQHGGIKRLTWIENLHSRDSIYFG